MPAFLNHVAVAAPRNGTTSHTVDPSSGSVVAGSSFTPTAGRFLLAFVNGPVTSTTPSGWTLPANGSAINFTGLYVWYKTAAGGDTLSTTHNASNYPVVFDFYEFPAGTTFQKAATATAVAWTGGAGPNLTALTGSNKTIFGAAAIAVQNSTTVTCSWGSGTEATDTWTAFASSTDGYAYSATYVDASAATSAQYAATFSGNGGGGANIAERLMVAIDVAAGGGALDGFWGVRNRVV